MHRLLLLAPLLAMPQDPVGPVRSVAVSPDGKLVASMWGEPTYQIRIWSAAGGKPYSTWNDLANVIAFSGDSKALATATSDIRFFDPAGTGVEDFILRGNGQPVISMVFSADGRTLVSGAKDGFVRIWNVKERREARTIQDGVAVQAVDLTRDGRTVASAARASAKAGDWSIRLFEASSANEIIRIPETKQPKCVAFSADGKSLAYGQQDDIRIVGVPKANEIAVLKGHQRPVKSIAWNPDGKTLTTASEDGTIRVWQIAGAKELRQWKADFEGDINQLAMSPDGKVMATAHQRGRVVVWQPATGKDIWKLR